MRSILVVTTVVLLCLCVVAPASGALIITDNTMAGSLPSTAQDLTTAYPTEIQGTLDFPDGVSMFKLYVTDASLFSAITLSVPFGVPDTELFLFDANGVGVEMNDDQTFSNTLSCLPSSDVSNPCPAPPPSGVGPMTNGVYYLAITRSENMALDSTLTNDLFSPLLSTDVVGPASSSPIGGWDNNVNTSPDFDLVNYDIILDGATPEPATWMLTAAAGLALLLRRRWHRL